MAVSTFSTFFFFFFFNIFLHVLTIIFVYKTNTSNSNAMLCIPVADMTCERHDLEVELQKVNGSPATSAWCSSTQKSQNVFS